MLAESRMDLIELTTLMALTNPAYCSNDLAHCQLLQSWRCLDEDRRVIVVVFGRLETDVGGGSLRPFLHRLQALR